MTLGQKRVAREFILEFSITEKLRSCSTIYLQQHKIWNRCEHPLCLTCSRQRANKAAAEVREMAKGFPFLISMTTSLAGTPSKPLRGIWDGLETVRGVFHGDRWLRSHVAAYRWQTELAKGPGGWNPHDAYVVALGEKPSPAEFENLRNECLSRYSTLAAKAGYRADPEHLHFDPVLRTPRRFIGYATKGPMALHGDSQTAGAVFMAAALQHDAEAAADWLEIEEASLGRRWQNKGGAFRKSTKSAPG